MKTNKKTTKRVVKTKKDKEVVNNGIIEIENAIDSIRANKELAGDMGVRYRKIVDNKKIREALFDRVESVLYSKDAMDADNAMSLIATLLGKKLNTKELAIWSVLCLLEASKIITINPNIYVKEEKSKNK